MTEDEIMKILDDMMDHYDELDKKNYEKGSKSEYAAVMWNACHHLKKRLQTAFKNKNK